MMAYVMALLDKPLSRVKEPIRRREALIRMI